MNVKILVFLLFTFLTLSNSENDDESCKWIYRCCKKVRGSCVEICEPEIICKETATEQEEPTVHEETTTQEEPSDVFEKPQGFNMIIAPHYCRHNFKKDSNGKCRRIMK